MTPNKAKKPLPSSTSIIFLEPEEPQTSREWKTALQRVKSLYLKSQWKQCAARSSKLLEISGSVSIISSSALAAANPSPSSLLSTLPSSTSTLHSPTKPLLAQRITFRRQRYRFWRRPREAIRRPPGSCRHWRIHLPRSKHSQMPMRTSRAQAPHRPQESPHPKPVPQAPQPTPHPHPQQPPSAKSKSYQNNNNNNSPL